MARKKRKNPNDATGDTITKALLVTVPLVGAAVVIGKALAPKTGVEEEGDTRDRPGRRALERAEAESSPGVKSMAELRREAEINRRELAAYRRGEGASAARERAEIAARLAAQGNRSYMEQFTRPDVSAAPAPSVSQKRSYRDDLSPAQLAAEQRLMAAPTWTKSNRFDAANDVWIWRRGAEERYQIGNTIVRQKKVQGKYGGWDIVWEPIGKA